MSCTISAYAHAKCCHVTCSKFHYSIRYRYELQQLKDDDHYHHEDAAEAFEDVLNEGFMVKQSNDGEMEVPYNVYKYVVARRQYEDTDVTTGHRTFSKTRPSSATKTVAPLKPIDVKKDPVTFDTWVRMKPAASEKIVKAIEKQIYNKIVKMNVLDVAPSPYAETAIAIASENPNASVVVTSKSLNMVEGIRGQISKHGLNNIDVKLLDASHLSSLQDKCFDIVVCSFGLTFLNSPKEALHELRRVLKPGGSLIVSVWEDLSLKQLSDYIVNELHADGSMEDFAVYKTEPRDVLGQLLPFAKPHELENVVSEGGFSLVRVDHETARILLSEADCKTTEEGVNLATLPIRPFLQELDNSGENKHAFDDAKRAFESLLKDPSLASRDKCGNLVTTLPSRFKVVTATRPHEDSDGYLEKNVTRSTKTSQKMFKYSDIPK